ncbi:2-amino-4-hydroxy-6-hydroxymethyldihydropteridine diphosphokinase [Microbacteriaceae bacterium SG_E_30_P1]|uniref:2-amino-4-hydroxy-6-hydroxymethyldihydropteridine diphosphokinase n=1 Tax=Antiquaquibacter oligotrophicus TaxID=2880260 RepID=A0ABT6KK74_9MICO|nr:2-amino-4-hydroxy-6-hydroxymethyldihydropteridine diphosphokinase [Antiquaquibacter oligotrophicus]MDH6179828.1 2-amino-4-hydroxy-6-hydroxymethyldihydropteridine diphosphokinase [Antiquaquibacter oligotrophicus]UDF14410.1 2-amino-4-hydroxy-6-hydroxymethyldihydropteridine diphosphokinase [Antiquaquibacter oligotrophicus]
MTRTVIALGSNLGERELTILDAVREIAELDGVELVAVSGLHETPALKPHGIDHEAPAYLNAVIVAESRRDPHDLLRALRGIEQHHGRVREERWGDRTLDLDIVDIEGVALATDDLTVPHPRAAERDFVLAPWLEADADAVLGGRRVSDLLAELRKST